MTYQDVYKRQNLLFSGTIAENLRWGKEDATDEELITGAKVAQADDFISAMPDGYQTMLGQAGAVSYTHLDVYKRQMDNSREELALIIY